MKINELLKEDWNKVNHHDHTTAKKKGVAEDTDKYAELSKKIRDLAQAGKEGEANKLRYELNRLLMLDRDKQRRKQHGVAEAGNPQQAAIVIAMKKAGKKPKHASK